MPSLNPHLLDTASPPIPEAKGWAMAYSGGAGPLIDLSQAVPGYPPPDALLARLRASGGDRASASYGPILGDEVLRTAYAAETAALYGGDVKAADVAITTGCNQAFFVAMVALAAAGDNVILPSPWYFNHKMTLDMLGIAARPLPCDPDAGFVPSSSQAEALIDAKTRAIVLVSPNNPTGAVYPAETIAAFAALCRRRGLWLMLDETYRDFIAGAPHALFADEWRDVLIDLYSFSKSYCIPGHRLGAIIADSAVMAEIEKVLDTLQICAPRVAQGPVAWGINALRDWRAHNTAEIERRQAAFREAFVGVNGWRIDSIGSYFAFLRHPFTGRTSAEVVKAFVEERGVLLLPGPYFGPGLETHMRVAFANADLDKIGQLRARFTGFGMGS
jgi:aspartate/methionine/tyrosine aminotransferase